MLRLAWFKKALLESNIDPKNKVRIEKNEEKETKDKKSERLTFEFPVYDDQAYSDEFQSCPSSGLHDSLSSPQLW